MSQFSDVETSKPGLVYGSHLSGAGHWSGLAGATLIPGAQWGPQDELGEFLVGSVELVGGLEHVFDMFPYIGNNHSS